MDFQTLSDFDLDAMRLVSKTIMNPAARWVTKGGHREKNFVLCDTASPAAQYRVFLRVSATRSNVFSVGLARTYSSEEVLILVRYNSGHRPHRNILERTRVPAVCHRHLATQRYIRAGLDPDEYAEPIRLQFRRWCLRLPVQRLRHPSTQAQSVSSRPRVLTCCTMHRRR